MFEKAVADVDQHQHLVGEKIKGFQKYTFSIEALNYILNDFPNQDKETKQTMFKESPSYIYGHVLSLSMMSIFILVSMPNP